LWCVIVRRGTLNGFRSPDLNLCDWHRGLARILPEKNKAGFAPNRDCHNGNRVKEKNEADFIRDYLSFLRWQTLKVGGDYWGKM
jgi:hypothetical protein